MPYGGDEANAYLRVYLVFCDYGAPLKETPKHGPILLPIVFLLEITFHKYFVPYPIRLVSGSNFKQAGCKLLWLFVLMTLNAKEVSVSVYAMKYISYKCGYERNLSYPFPKTSNSRCGAQQKYSFKLLSSCSHRNPLVMRFFYIA